MTWITCCYRWIFFILACKIKENILLTLDKIEKELMVFLNFVVALYWPFTILANWDKILNPKWYNCTRVWKKHVFNIFMLFFSLNLLISPFLFTEVVQSKFYKQWIFALFFIKFIFYHFLHQSNVTIKILQTTKILYTYFYFLYNKLLYCTMIFQTWLFSISIKLNI